MEIMPILKQMLILLVLLVVGVVAAKTGVVDSETNRRLTSFALAIPQSAMILSSVINVELDMTAGKLLGVIGAGCVMYGLFLVMGFLVPRIYRVKPTDRGIYSFMTVFGNVGFMGFPVVNAIFGSTAVFYAALLNIHFNVLAYTLGIAELSSAEGKVRVDWRKIINAPMVAALAAIVLLIVNIHIPDPVAEAVDMLGDSIVPLSMIIIGASLGDQRFRDVFGDWRTYAFAPVPLLAAPVLAWLVLRLIVKDSVLLGTMTVLAAMPVASAAVMLAIEYGGDEKLASRTVFVTTVLSVATIPLVCWLLPL